MNNALAPDVLREKIEAGNTKPTIAKRMMNYDHHNPHCGSCVQYKGKGFVMKSNSKAKFVANEYCQLGHFSIHAGGCCDLWESKKGDRLQIELVPYRSRKGGA